MRHLYESKPVVAYKRPPNIHEGLTHTKLSKSVVSYNVTKYDRRRCSHCSAIRE